MHSIESIIRASMPRKNTNAIATPHALFVRTQSRTILTRQKSIITIWLPNNTHEQADADAFAM